MTIVRFAPSPTGLLHVGNARTAMLNWLFAKKENGKFLVRIDDTDTDRGKKEYEDAILEDLAWLGLTYDMFARQSERSDAHRTAAEMLKAKGRLYPAYESADELERRRKRQIAAHRPPVYDRAALNLSAEERAKLEAEGRKPHWRFKLSQTKVRWLDLVRGEVEIDTAHLSDPVLIREDGRFLYTLPSVADDVDFNITHVIRGEDHVTNTAVQIEIFEALGTSVPVFAHFPLLVGAGGEALSKRIGSLSLQEIRADEIEPLALACYLAKTGTSNAIELRPSLDALVQEFDFAKIGRAPAHFDKIELEKLNARLLHSLPFEAVAERLTALGITGGEKFWDAIRPNLPRFGLVTFWWELINGPKEGRIIAPELTAKAAELLPPEPWSEDTWAGWTKAVSEATGAKGKELYQPLRTALTWLDHGPEMKRLLPLIGRDRALAQLKGEIA